MKTPSSQKGIAIIEAIVAIVILSIGVIGALTLQMRATAGLSDSRARTEASLAAEELLGMMWNDQANVNAGAYNTGGANLVNWNNRLTSNIPGATATVNVVQVAIQNGVRQQVTIRITWKRRANDDVSSHQVIALLEPSI